MNSPRTGSCEACSRSFCKEVEQGGWVRVSGLKGGPPKTGPSSSPQPTSPHKNPLPLPPAQPPTLAGARQAALHPSVSAYSSCPQADPRLSRNWAPWWRRGRIAPQRRVGCPGHPAPRAWAAGTSSATARLVPAQVGWGQGGRTGIQGLLLTPFLSLAEDAELVQCKYLGRGPCRRDERDGDRYWGPWLPLSESGCWGQETWGGGLIPCCCLHAL